MSSSLGQQEWLIVDKASLCMILWYLQLRKHIANKCTDYPETKQAYAMKY